MDHISEELLSRLDVGTPAFTIPLFGGIPVPVSVVTSWIIMAFLVLLSIIFVRNLKMVPDKKQMAIEIAIEWLNNFFYGILGEKGKRYIPYLGTVLLYIACSNLIGLVGLNPPTKDLNVTAALALMSIFLVEYAGIREKGPKGWLKAFAEPTPIMLPMNILEIAIRPVSLCMRLFGNILGGFVVMELIKIVAPAIIPIPFSGYFDIFDGLIQAYVFVFLTTLFIKEAIE